MEQRIGPLTRIVMQHPTGSKSSTSTGVHGDNHQVATSTRLKIESFMQRLNGTKNRINTSV
eukprot:4142128-Amphidinium_carterae.1